MGSCGDGSILAGGRGRWEAVETDPSWEPNSRNHSRPQTLLSTPAAAPVQARSKIFVADLICFAFLSLLPGCSPALPLIYPFPPPSLF